MDTQKTFPLLKLPKVPKWTSPFTGGAQSVPVANPQGSFSIMNDSSFGAPGVRSTDLDFGGPEQFSLFPEGAEAGSPGVEGKWLKPANFGLGVAKVGLSVYNAMEQTKMNDFMKDYYGDQMNLQRTDFANAARSSNELLSSRKRRALLAAGQSEEQAVQGTADYMAKWGAQETVA